MPSSGGAAGGIMQQRLRFGDAGTRDRRDRDLARTLGTFPVFAACSPGDLEALARAGRVTSLPVGWTFLHEGTPADACYVLLDGEVRVLRGGVERAALGPGAVLGEMALLGHSLRRASVVTRTVIQALRVEYDVLTTLLHANPRLAESVVAVFDQHRAADQHRAPRTVSDGASSMIPVQVESGQYAQQDRRT